MPCLDILEQITEASIEDGPIGINCFLDYLRLPFIDDAYNVMRWRLSNLRRLTLRPRNFANVDGLVTMLRSRYELDEVDSDPLREAVLPVHFEKLDMRMYDRELVIQVRAIVGEGVFCGYVHTGAPMVTY